MNQAALHRLLISEEGTKGAHTIEKLFKLRLATNLSLIKTLFFSLYPESSENQMYFHNLLNSMEHLFGLRPDELKKLDLERVEQGNWYQNERLVGMQLYADRFNKDINGLVDRLSYLENLGINFLHIMPITTRPSGESDGGYAVNNYHEIDAKFGTKDDFLALTTLARSKNILLMLDFVVNHTSDEFSWAKKAKAGEEKYQNYYYTYPDRTIPDEFEKTLPEIFPESAPGSFTHVPEMDKWVMTCFNNYQWDLNYTNPEVFIEMLGNLVKMANMGVDVVRFDALAFLWKKLGTISQNLPEAHELISLFRLCLQVIAPGVILLAEAIVAPRNIIKYFGEGILEGNECEVAYNASLMALIWNSIATKQTSLLYKSLMEIPKKPNDGTWINYIRCHDDIGLGYDDDFMRDMGWNPSAHRKFLLDYYCQGLEWSPARGLIFMYNPKNGDGRITGSAASLLGLEKALEEKDQVAIDLSIAKILMLHGIILSYGGIPMIYMGDELGTLNDYSFRTNAEHKNDSRWVNRPIQDWKVVDNLKSKKNHSFKIYDGLKKLIQLRKKLPLLADSNNLTLHPSSNSQVFVFERTTENESLWIISNFDEAPQFLEVGWLFSIGISFGRDPKDLITKKALLLDKGRLKLNPYQHMWVALD